ncbi:MAG: TRAP transporter small permease [Sedimentisphaerales bacterium]|nr:TRAP transporter small permease [Sedimentisphaerales bacterium]
MKIIDKTLDLLLFLILAAMALTMAANVFCRSVLKFSLYWGDELTQVLMVWLTFLGAAVAMREHAHYRFDYFSRVLHGRAKRLYLLTTKIIVLVAIVLLLYWSTLVTVRIRGWIMPAMEYSRAWVYGACPVGSAFMLIYGVRDLVLFLGKAEE